MENTEEAKTFEVVDRTPKPEKAPVPQNTVYYHSQIKKMRWIMLIFGLIYTFGLIPAVRGYSTVILSFVPPAFFIISGYLVLRKSDDIEKRILRTIKRTAICFLILTVVYFLLSLLVDKESTLEIITQKTFWTEFLLFNIWNLPIGSTIWYVQSLLYAYIFIYILYKLKLLKLDILFAVIFLAVTVLSGELSAVIGFNFLGHTVLGGNFVTRAIPYILIGCFIHRKKRFFLSINKSSYVFYIFGIFVGTVLSLAEYYVLFIAEKLVYPGHMLGTVIVAVSACCLCFFANSENIRYDFFSNFTRFEIMIPFFVCSPVYYVFSEILKIDAKRGMESVSDISGLMTIFVSFLIFIVYAIIRAIIRKIKNKKK